MISWFEKHNKISWAITILIAIGIFYISSLTFAPGPSGKESILPTLYHILAFFFLTLFLFIASLKNRKEPFILVIFIVLLYAILDEVHQFFVPGRTCSIFDVFLDNSGIIFASLIYFIARIKHFKNTFFFSFQCKKK